MASTHSRLRLRSGALLVTVLGALIACGTGDDAAGSRGGSSDVPIDGFSCNPAPFFQAQGCVGCHGSIAAPGSLNLNLPLGEITTALLDAPATSSLCEGRRLIDSRDPELSVLLTSVDHTRRAKEGACSLVMPPGTAKPSAEDVACLETFVREAAARAAPAVPFQPSTMDSALAKVKLLSSGAAVTGSELTYARQSPAALRELIDGWSQDPAFEIKMKEFLGTALQQDSIGKMVETLGFPVDHYYPPAARREALRSSFVRTAWDIVARGQPFTQVVTTRRFAVTTAELVILAFADQTGSEVDAETNVKIVPPRADLSSLPTLRQVGDVLEVGGIADSDADCKLNPRGQTLSNRQMLNLLFGKVQCRGRGDVYPKPTVGGEDYGDFRFVTFVSDPRQPSIGYREVGRLRAIGSEGVFPVRNSRVGFFSTPAFLDNWPSNLDNQFRVTLNQALIVGLDATFSEGDSTAQSLLSANDDVHAPSGGGCFGCHRLMDPMRGFFSSNFDFGYFRSTSPPAQASFAFLGRTSQGTGLEDFARGVAEHPRFATAWVLKLCSWANSRRCSDAEPGVTTLAKSFVDSNFDFRRLVVDLLASPLVTGLSGSALSVPNPVSIARRRHFCDAMAARLGPSVRGAPACTSVVGRDLSLLLPDDAFARGRTGLVLSSTPTTFQTATLDRLCSGIANDVVRARFPFRNEAEIDESIRSLVRTVMGLPEGHPRNELARAALDRHYRMLTGSGNGATSAEAMQSAFITACNSADSSGAGL